MKKITLIIAMCFGVVVMQAQNSMTSLQYSMGFGTGDMSNFIGSASFRGATFEWRKNVNPNVGVGIEAGWNVFYTSKPSDSYEYGNATLTGKQWRYQNAVPLLAAADYYFSPGEKFNPFVGLGLGTMYSRRNTDMAQYTIEQDAWHFAVRPEVGFMYQVNDGFALLAALKYYNGFGAGDLKSTQSYLTLNLGLAFTR